MASCIASFHVRIQLCRCTCRNNTFFVMSLKSPLSPAMMRRSVMETPNLLMVVTNGFQPSGWANAHMEMRLSVCWTQCSPLSPHVLRSAGADFRVNFKFPRIFFFFLPCSVHVSVQRGICFSFHSVMYHNYQLLLLFTLHKQMDIT
jgi:hypothetical protein